MVNNIKKIISSRQVKEVKPEPVKEEVKPEEVKPEEESPVQTEKQILQEIDLLQNNGVFRYELLNTLHNLISVIDKGLNSNE